eukprot:CAMPEP_0201605392 /NCGR_PEP_ID=MMETSP0492-20130828/5225_1 /ASSEMBLY_ACC=CAM_ASM_000837 /TAXON_ID=420259 /ORGANISM="Thalassiosira gravida, Strain GMp14c1" /LENGTH=164 /DNA_ID=CAMNT_0048069633 /DNA_START=40 /DNA_END=534 /DNA_ORIENTATION=+
MISPRFAVILAAIVIGTTTTASSTDRPNFIGTARVKQHMHRTGDLVEGEQHLLKLIIKWQPIPGAEGYELCHECNHIDETTGRETGTLDADEGTDGTVGTTIPIEIGGKNVCGGQPCHVMPAAAKGHNKFHLRVKKGGHFGLWSKLQNFDVAEPGTFQHIELEL